MKKLLVAVLVLCLALSMDPAFALELLSGVDIYPVESDKTITWYAQGGLNPHEKFADWKESPFHTGLIRETGINIEWMFPTTGTDGGVYTNTLLADPTKLPDIMQGYFMDSASQYLGSDSLYGRVRSRLLRLPEGASRLRQGDEDRRRQVLRVRLLP